VIARRHELDAAVIEIGTEEHVELARYLRTVMLRVTAVLIAFEPSTAQPADDPHVFDMTLREPLELQQLSATALAAIALYRHQDIHA
jgi:hypothetical protein